MPADQLETDIQHAQDQYRSLEEQLKDLDEETADSLRRALEDTEDAGEDVEDASDASAREDALTRVREHIQTAQDATNDLQDRADGDLFTALETLDDRVEQVEDYVTDELLESGDTDEDEEDDSESDGYEVTVSGETKRLEERYIDPIDLLREFEYDPNQYVLYPPDG